MISYKIEIYKGKDREKEVVESVTLQDAWEEFVNQTANNQDNYEKLTVQLYVVDSLLTRDLLLFQYDSNCHYRNLSLMYGNREEAILEKYDLMDIDF